jgi:2'-5' RNA ligase
MTSIWLQLEESQDRALQAVIDRMAEANDTVSFRPHLTVCGVPGDIAVLDNAAAYIRDCALLPLKVAKTAVAGALITPFRAVFIEVENSPALREFRERLREIVGAPGLVPPHISLLYTLDRISQAPRSDFDEPRLVSIAAKCTDAIPNTHFTLDRPVVNSSGGGEINVRGWKVIRSF